MSATTVTGLQPRDLRQQLVPGPLEAAGVAAHEDETRPHPREGARGRASQAGGGAGQDHGAPGHRVRLGVGPVEEPLSKAEAHAGEAWCNQHFREVVE